MPRRTPNRRQRGSPEHTVTLRRREDQLSLRVELYNLRLDDAGKLLIRHQRDQDAYVVILFPPQHLMEESGYEYDKDFQPEDAPEPTEDVPPDFPAGSRLAGPSRLAFRMPEGQIQIDFELQALLAWEQWAPSLVPVANGPDTPSPDLQPPGPTHTALELPWWLILSPNGLGGWKHALKPVTHGGRTELWHTRLGMRGPDGDIIEGAAAADAMKVRAVWTRDPGFAEYLVGDPQTPLPYNPVVPPDGEDTGPGMPFRTALSPRDRFDLVICTADFANRISQTHSVSGLSYLPQPADVNRLMLTPLGGWLDVHGAWPKQAHARRGRPVEVGSGTSLESWRHTATLGRDHYVRIVRRGYLFPFGLAASLVKVTERKFLPAQGGRYACNMQRYFIMVRERRIHYGGAGHVHQGRGFPFTRIICKTMVTPNLDPPGEHDGNTLNELWANQTSLFVPRVQGKPFTFNLVGLDHMGRQIDLQAPVLFADGQVIDGDKDGSNVSALIDFYNDQSNFAVDDPERAIRLQGATVAVAPIGIEPPGATDLEIHRFTLGADRSTSGKRPPFHPAMAEASVRLAAVEAILGAPVEGSNNLPAFKFEEAYLEHGFGLPETAGELFVRVVEPQKAVKADFGAEKAGDRCGGVITPNIEVSALSRRSGPVGGDIKEYQVSSSDQAFDPAEFFPKNAFLLGDIRLGEVVKKADRKDAIKLTTRQTGSAMITELTWHPELQRVPANGTGDNWLFDPAPGGSLKIQALITVPKDASGPITEIFGDLRKFQIGLLPGARFIVIHFDRLHFQSRTGAKTNIDVEIAKVDFAGPLEFVNKLKDYLSFTGGGLEIDLLPTHLSAGFALPVPNISIGVFSISNIAFRAGAIIPFTGKPVRFRFGFSSRDDVFNLSVMIFGGGGFFELEIGPDGVEALQLALEFGVTAAIDFGVAAGSVKVVAGIYIAMGVGSETNPDGKLELTGFLLIEGKVEVMLVVTLTIRMEAAITYVPDTKKAIVRASVLVEVKVLLFSDTVEVKYQRTFGGSADPTFGETLTQSDWDHYADAFAPIGV